MLPDSGFVEKGIEIGKLLREKQAAYGNSFYEVPIILKILYPGGIGIYQYDDVLTLVRILDKMFRIARKLTDGSDPGGENPYRDIAGYAILALARREPTNKEEANESKDPLDCYS